MGVTNVGKQQILEWIIGNDPSFPSHIGVGSGTTDFNTTETTLVNEVFPDSVDRNAIDPGTRAGKQATIEMLLQATDLTASGDPGGITESGLFDASTAGNMFTRNKFNEVPKDSNTEVTVVESVRFV